jgi:hypothetical protein
MNPVVTCVNINSPQDTTNATSFEVCATSFHYSPSPAMEVNETTGEYIVKYVGGWGHDFTIYKSSAKGLDTYYDEDLIPQDAKTNIEVSVDRNDNNTCTVDVKTAKMTTAVTCNSCTFCNVDGDAYSNDGDSAYSNDSDSAYSNDGDSYSNLFSADCTNIKHGRIVVCESANDAFFPLTEAALS